MNRSYPPLNRSDLGNERHVAAQQGLSLVELMIAMTLGLLVIGGLTQVYLGGRDANRIIENNSFLNDNGRFAMEFFARDLRMAGYFSCQGDNAVVGNAVDIGNVNGTPTQQFWFKLPGSSTLPLGLEGFEVGVHTLPTPLNTLGAPSGTDMFVATSPRVCESTNADLDTGNKTFSFNDYHHLSAGDIVVMNAVNCDQTSFFQVTSAQDDNTAHHIGYGDNAGISPGNCTAVSTGSYLCSISQSVPTTPSLTDTHVNGAVMAKYIARAYYVANDPGNCPNAPGDCNALSQCPTLFAIGNETAGRVPVLRNVTDMQIEYGYNPGIAASNGLVVSRSENSDLEYRTASQVAPTSADLTTNDNEWLKVASIKITVTLITNQCKEQTFSTTVALRNAGRIARSVP